MDLENLLHKKKDLLTFFSPYRFIRRLDSQFLVDNTVIEPLIKSLKDGSVVNLTIVENYEQHHFLVEKLEWDSAYFGFDHYKILNVLFDHSSFNILSAAVRTFLNDFCTESRAYYYLDLPHEAILLYQAFTINGFRSIENRMNLYYENVLEYKSEKRYPTRLAFGIDDAEKLQEVAMKMRNPYDRFHADILVPDCVADKYIGQFAYNSVMGFADYVIVPNLPDKPPFGFLTANHPKSIGDFKVSPLVLAAIDNKNFEKGWFIKLISEMTYLLKDQKVDFLKTTTQTSNIPALKSWEKFGFKIGFFSGILAYKNQSKSASTVHTNPLIPNPTNP